MSNGNKLKRKAKRLIKKATKKGLKTATGGPRVGISKKQMPKFKRGGKAKK